MEYKTGGMELRSIITFNLANLREMNGMALALGSIAFKS